MDDNYYQNSDMNTFQHKTEQWMTVGHMDAPSCNGKQEERTFMPLRTEKRQQDGNTDYFDLISKCYIPVLMYHFIYTCTYICIQC